MKKIIKFLCIFALIFINVYIHMFPYNKSLVDILIIIFTSIFCLLLGRESYCYKHDMIKYIVIYIFWNMNYLFFVKHLSTLDCFINTLLFKNVFIDILAVLAIGNILLYIFKLNKNLNILFSIIFIILYIIFNINVFIYVSIFLIGNILKLKDLIGVKGNFFKIMDNLNIGILILHKLVLYLVLNSNFITPTISNFIGTIVLIYVVCTAITFYVKAYPLIGDII